MQGLSDWVVAIAGVVAIPLVTFLVARSSRKATSEQTTITTLNSRVESLEKQSRLQGDYIYELRAEISNIGGTPPPWPEEMNR